MEDALGGAEAAGRAGRREPAGARLGPTCAALWALLALLWWLDASGRAAAPALAQAAALAALAATAAWAGAWAVRRARAGDVALPVLLALALAVRLAGLDHEIAGRYYGDEGTYYRQAKMIDAGRMLGRSFVYPHLTYYADAFALWLGGLFPQALPRLAAALSRAAAPLEVEWLLLRLVAALAGALTVVPVFLVARRFGGRVAGAVAGGLVIVSPLYNQGGHLATCDVPAAFLATVALAFVARLAEAERTRDYAAAGLFAGLAAAAKYPAGLVAVAIAAAWLRWRLRRRDWSAGLLWGALAALAAFVAAMPSLLAFPEVALWGKKGMLFGARQYGRHGWIGVVPESAALYYLQVLRDGLGLPALLAGGAGLFLVPRERRGGLLALAAFPAAYLALLAAMSMVVVRNVYPALPVLAVFLGIGFAALAGRVRQAAPRLAPSAVVGLALACLGPPAARTLAETVGLARPSTRELAAGWMLRRLPPGARLVKEQYTPHFAPSAFDVVEPRFAGRIRIAELRRPENDYLLLAGGSYGRFLKPDLLRKPHQRQIAARYREILATFPPVATWAPDRFRQGPLLRLFRIEPVPEACRAGGRLPAAAAFAPEPSRLGAGEVRYAAAGQWALFKGCFEPGAYRVAVEGAASGPGTLRALDAGGRPVGLLGIGDAGAAVLELPRRGKYFLYPSLPAGSRVRALVLAPASAPGAGAPGAGSEDQMSKSY